MSPANSDICSTKRQKGEELRELRLKNPSFVYSRKQMDIMGTDPDSWISKDDVGADVRIRLLWFRWSLFVLSSHLLQPWFAPTPNPPPTISSCSSAYLKNVHISHIPSGYLHTWAQLSKLTEETGRSSHHWVEITAIARGYGLVRPVKLFGCVLDEEHHRFCDGDLREAKTQKSGLQTQSSQTSVFLTGLPLCVCVCVCMPVIKYLSLKSKPKTRVGYTLSRQPSHDVK